MSTSNKYSAILKLSIVFASFFIGKTTEDILKGYLFCKLQQFYTSMASPHQSHVY